MNAVFDALAETLERETYFDRLAARGTLRLALREAGLDPGVGVREWLEVVDRVLPGELASRRVDRPEVVCEKLRLVALAQLGSSDGGSSASPPLPALPTKEQQ